MTEKTYTARSVRRTMRIVKLYRILWSTYSPHGRRAKVSLPRVELTFVLVRFAARIAFLGLLLAALLQKQIGLA